MKRIDSHYFPAVCLQDELIKIHVFIVWLSNQHRRPYVRSKEIPIIVVDECVTMDEGLILEETDSAWLDSVFLQPLKSVSLVPIVLLVGDDNNVSDFLKRLNIFFNVRIGGGVKEYFFCPTTEEIIAC